MEAAAEESLSGLSMVMLEEMGRIGFEDLMNPAAAVAFSPVLMGIDFPIFNL